MIPTGIGGLDCLLGGGVRPGTITCVFGAAGTGKTQLLLQLCAGCRGRALYVDTTGGFRPERIAGRGDLGRITVSRATNTHEQAGALDGAGRYSLVAVDNVTDLFSYEYGAEGAAPERNAVFGRYARLLAGTAASGAPVVISNMVRTVDGREVENMAAALRPHVHVRVRLEKGARYCTGRVELAAGGAEWASGGGAFRYVIGPGGLADAEDI